MKRRVLSKTTSFHTLFIKKRREGGRNGAILKALWVFFFLWTREIGEEEDLFSPVSHRLPFPQ
jgi:hypothetical protein